MNATRPIFVTFSGFLARSVDVHEVLLSAVTFFFCFCFSV